MRKRKPTSSVAKTAKGGNFTYFHNELNFSNARSPAYPACIYLPKKIRQVAPQQEFLVFVRARSVRSNFYVAFSSSRSTLTYCKMPFCAFLRQEHKESVVGFGGNCLPPHVAGIVGILNAMLTPDQMLLWGWRIPSRHLTNCHLHFHNVPVLRGRLFKIL